ncbi:MAG: type II toxin-antitoxin system prevent-host-death family antitoxin [Bacteroidota bacterium]
MKTLEISKARRSLASYSRKARKGPMVVTANGKPIAALIGIQNAAMETVTLSNHPRFLALIERSRQRMRSEGGISSEQMRRRLNLKPKRHSG